MNNIFPIDVPLTVVWHFTKPDGTDFSLSGYICKLFYQNVKGKTEVASTMVSVSTNTLSFVFPTKNRMAGQYSLQLCLYQNGGLFSILNYNNAFCFSRDVPHPATTQDQEDTGRVVHLFTAAEYYLLSPVVPTVGEDLYWYANGVKVTDSQGNWVSAEHTVRYDAESRHLIIDDGRVDAQGESIEQVITDIDDFLTMAEGNEETRQENEESRIQTEARMNEVLDSIVVNFLSGTDLYEQAVEQGFEGTKEEWLTSTLGVKGVGIASWEIDQSTADSGTTTHTITFNDVDKPDGPTVVTFTVKNGKGVASMTQTTTSTASEGDNVITVTYSDGTTSTFTVKNGARGNSGYTGAAGELEVVNDLDADDPDADAAKALSAYQGYVLDGKVTELGQNIDETFVQIGKLAECIDYGHYYNMNGTKAAASNYRCIQSIIRVEQDIMYYHLAGGSLPTVRCYDDSMTYLGDATRSGGKIALQSGTKKVAIHWASGGDTPDVYDDDYFIFDVTLLKVLKNEGDITALRSDMQDELLKKVDFNSLNLYNPNDSGVESGYINSNGGITPTSSYVTTAFIPVTPGTTYYKAKDSSKDYRYYLFFDSSKNVVTGSWTANASSFLVPTGTAYVRVSLYSNDDKPQIAPVNMKYSPYSPISKWLYDLVGDFKDDSDKKVIQKADKYLTEFHLIGQHFIDNEYYSIATGAVYSADTYARTDLIPVTKKQYKFYNFAWGSLCCFDSSKAFLGVASRNNNVVTLLDNTAYIGWNFPKSSQPAGYVDNGLFYNLEPYISLFENAENVLSGKKWVVVGDSFSEWSNAKFADGPYINKYKTYKFFIALRNDMNIVDMTLSGRTMAYPSDHTFDNAFSKPSLYQSIPTDADYITIMLGINDVAHLAGYSPDGESAQGAISLGTIDSVDTGTFYGAWNVVMQWIFENCPTAHVGIIITNGLGSQGPNGGYSTYGMQIYEALKDIVARWNVPFIDLNGGDGKTPMMQRGIYPEGTPTALIAAKWNAFATAPTEPYNGHTNADGHLYESTFIENFLRSI